MIPIHKKTTHADKYSYLNEVFIQSVNVTEPGWDDFKPEHYPNYRNILDITFDIRVDCKTTIIYRYNAKYLCPFDAAVSEDEFIPFLLKCICHAYTVITGMQRANYFRIIYSNIFKENYKKIIMDRKKAKTNAAVVKELYIRLDFLSKELSESPTVVPGKVIQVGTYTKAVDPHPKRDTLQEPWFKKLWKRIKNVWIR